jgi:putative DNA primase/helicase
MDADPYLLCTPAGMVDLRTGVMRPHRREDYCTKITAVGPGGECPKFKAFLRRVMRDDDELVGFIKRALGYSLTGDTSEQAIFFNYGVGQNGKSVLIETASGILADYCIATPIETFTETRNERHPTELARMRGARLVTATETEAGRYWAESRLKEITGGERIAARFMNKDFFEYTPQFKPWVSGNHRPRLRSVGKAMRRRIKMIPFAFTIPDKERDRGFAAKLKDEWPGILKLMIEGCLEWQKKGLAPPPAVEQATDAHFAAEDGYSAWIADRCETSGGFAARSTQLFGSWRDWADKAGQRAGDNKQFREEMERLGYPLQHTRTGNIYVGLRIRQDRPEPEDRERSAAADLELDLAQPDPVTPVVKACEGFAGSERHARARERIVTADPSPAFTVPLGAESACAPNAASGPTVWRSCAPSPMRRFGCTRNASAPMPIKVRREGSRHTRRSAPRRRASGAPCAAAARPVPCGSGAAARSTSGTKPARGSTWR